MSADWVVLWDRVAKTIADGPRRAILAAVAAAAGGTYAEGTNTLNLTQAGARASVPAAGEWATDPNITAEVGAKTLWYPKAYHWAEIPWTFDRVSFNLTTGQAVTGTISLYAVDANGNKTGGALASATFDATAAGTKTVAIAGTFARGANMWEFTGVTSACAMTSARQIGPGANINAAASFNNSLPFPRGSALANSNWVPLVWARRSA